MSRHLTSDGQVPTAAVYTEGDSGRERTTKSVFARLTAMMLLEFFVWGAWFATLGLVLASNKLTSIIGTAFTLAALAAIVSPMFLGAIGDRFLASQKVLGIAHLVGGALMLLLPSAVAAGQGLFVLLLIFVYMLFFQPTLGLANNIAFRHIGGNSRLFPYIRVFGTGGWFLAGAFVGALGLSASTGVFYVTAIASFVLGVYAFTLPRTTPPARGVKFCISDVVGAKAFVLFQHRNFTVFMVCAFMTSIALGVYNSYASTYLGVLGIKNVAGLLSLGQLSEVAFILTIPWVLTKFGIKWSLLAGMFMWCIRLGFFLFAAHDHTWAVLVAILLQGICNDFFLVMAAMYLDRVAPLELTAQTQTMLILVVSGFGGVVGAFVSGQIYSVYVAAHASGGAAAWWPLWLVPIIAALIAAALWITLFRYRRNQTLERYVTESIRTVAAAPQH